MTFAIAPLYAGLLGLLLVGLSVPVMLMRRRLRIGLGDGGDAALLRAMRVQANFAEYAPLGLILVFAVEALGYAPPIVHALGALLVAGRLAHAQGLMSSDGVSIGRAFGMTLTWTTISLASLLCLVAAGR